MSFLHHSRQLLKGPVYGMNLFLPQYWGELEPLGPLQVDAYGSKSLGAAMSFAMFSALSESYLLLKLWISLICQA